MSVQSDVRASWESKLRKYALCSGITAVVLIVQGIVSFLANSLALGSDTIHVGSDLAAMLGALIVTYRELNMSHDAQHQMKTRFAYFAMLLLVFGSLTVFMEAWERWQVPQDVLSLWVMAVAFAGLLGNAWAHQILHSVPHEDRDVVHRGAHLHVLSDMLLSVAVIVAAGVTYLTGWMQADALTSAAIALYMLFLAYRLFTRVRKGDVGHCGHHHH